MGLNEPTIVQSSTDFEVLRAIFERARLAVTETPVQAHTFLDVTSADGSVISFEFNALGTLIGAI